MDLLKNKYKCDSKIFLYTGFNTTGKPEFSSWKTVDISKCTDVSDCLAVPFSYLRNVSSDVNSPVHVHLHAFNIAGKHCTVLSEQFYIPSAYKPEIGSVRDIYPEEPFADQDVSFSQTTYCVAWTGISDHMDHVTIETGLGSSAGIDDVENFQPVPVDDQFLHCRTDVGLTVDNTYFSVIRVNNSAGSTNASSDGFRVLSENNVVNALSVFDGPGCSDDFIYQWTIETPADGSDVQTVTTTCPHNLHIGQQYTIHYPVDETSEADITSDDVVFTKREPGQITFVPTKHMPTFTTTVRFSDEYTTFSLNQCIEDIDHLPLKNPIDVHWTLSVYTDLVTHFEISLFLNETDNSITAVDTKLASADSRIVRFNAEATQDGGYFTVEVRQCFGMTCLSGVFSDGFLVEDAGYTGGLTAMVEEYETDCSMVAVSWNDARCSQTTGSSPLFYRWRLAYDENGLNSSHTWTTYTGEVASDGQHKVSCVTDLDFWLFPLN